MKFTLRHTPLTLPFALFCCLAFFTPGQAPAAAQKADTADLDEQNDPNSFIETFQFAITFAPGVVSQLLEEAPAGFMHVRDKDGLTILHRAIFKRCTRDSVLLELFKLLVNHPTFTAEDLNVRVCNEKDPYHDCSVLDMIIGQEDAEKMDDLLNSCQLDQKAVSTLMSTRNAYGKNAVLVAAACEIGTKALLLRTLLNHPRVASEIINATEDDNCEFPESNALHLAIAVPLIPRPARVEVIYTSPRFTQANAYDRNGFAPLHTAVLCAHNTSKYAWQQAYVEALECIKILLTEPRSQHSTDTDDRGGAAADNEPSSQAQTGMPHPHDVDPNVGTLKRSLPQSCLEPLTANDHRDRLHQADASASSSR